MAAYERLARAVRAQIPVGVATLIAGIDPPGARMLVFLDGSQEGELGLGPLDGVIAEDVREAVRASRSETRSYPLRDRASGSVGESAAESVQVFIESHVPPPSLIIVGAGHTSIPLATMGRLLGFKVTLIDARAAFATPERFGDVDEIVVDWPHKVLAERPITETTYVAVLTHDPKFEEPLLPILLRSPARYIGVIGSRRTQVQRREHLRASGFGDEDLRRLSGPIGLDIGAVTPEEVALSIMAEIVAKEHGRPGGFLSEKLPAAVR